MIYKGVIYGKEKHIYYLDSPTYEKAMNWLEYKCDDLSGTEFEINLEETENKCSDYVPFVENTGKVVHIWFDSHQEAVDCSQWLGSVAQWGYIEPIVVADYLD